jgi:hypothetical protein
MREEMDVQEIRTQGFNPAMHLWSSHRHLQRLDLRRAKDIARHQLGGDPGTTEWAKATLVARTKRKMSVFYSEADCCCRRSGGLSITKSSRDRGLKQFSVVGPM